MSLARRARAMHRARPGDEHIRAIALLAAFAVAAVAVALDGPQALLVSGLLAGYAFRPEADRYYLEGFSDGLAAAQLVDQAGADHRAVAPGRVDGLRDGAGDDAGQPWGTDRETPRAPSRRFGPVGEGAAGPDLADVAGVRAGRGPARHPVDDRGVPTAGPRPPGIVPPAAAVGVRREPTAGPAAGAEARPVVGPAGSPASLNGRLYRDANGIRRVG